MVCVLFCWLTWLFVCRVFAFVILLLVYSVVVTGLLGCLIAVLLVAFFGEFR